MKLNYIKQTLRISNSSLFSGSIKQFNKSTLFNKLSFKRFSISIKNKFNNGVVKLPHFSKIEKGGEDAYIAHEGIICVSDGVGGWAEHGVDPAKYSLELCHNINKLFIEKGNTLFHQPKQLFSESVTKTLNQGSATCCFCVLDLEKEYIHTLNLGDSGYIILRKQQNDIKNKDTSNSASIGIEVVFRSEEQTHSFNFPFQVGTGGDDPNSAMTNVHKFKENDIIILGTDGLWDNLFDEQIIRIVKPFLEGGNVIRDINLLAEMIGITAEKYSLNQHWKSPFCVRSNGQYMGGKPDDITIIVTQIVKNEKWNEEKIITL